MSTPLTENLKRTAHYLVSEANGYQSREAIVIASGAGKVLAGTVLGRVTASKKYVPWTAGASDGSQTAAAILYAPVDATSADARGVGTVRMSEIQADVLVWPNGTADATKTAQLAELAKSHIAAR